MKFAIVACALLGAVSLAAANNPCKYLLAILADGWRSWSYSISTGNIHVAITFVTDCIWPKNVGLLTPDKDSSKYLVRGNIIKLGVTIKFACPSGYELGEGRHSESTCHSYGWYGLVAHWKKCVKKSKFISTI